MGFAAGSVSFRRFLVVGKSPDSIDQDLLDKLSAHVLEPDEMGIPEEVEYGWCGGRHILDGKFSFEHNVFADALFCAMRLDTNRVPSELKKAYQIQEEDAAAAENPSGFISKSQKRDVKDVVRRKLEDEIRSGRFRRSKLVPILWDLPTGMLYSPASASATEKLMELFERTFGLQLEPQSAGSLSLRVLETAGKHRDYEDLRPTRFAIGASGESRYPEYPWTAKGPQPKDFLGNEFLLWLWHTVDVHGGTIKLDGSEVAVMIDKSLDLDCAYGDGGRDLLKGDGPTQMPEARDAIKSGKVPRRMGMVIHTGGSQFTFNFNGESLGFNSAQLPEVEEAENPRVLFEERISFLRDLCKGMDSLFAAFLKQRTSSAWEGHTQTMRHWLAGPRRQAEVA